MGKILIVEIAENEDVMYQQILDWLSWKLNCIPAQIKQHKDNAIINFHNRTFSDRNGNKIYLTAKEFDFLSFLYSHKGQVFSKEQIYDLIWGYDYAGSTSNLSSFVCKLRKKIEPNPCRPTYIITVWGIGYKFDDKSIE